MLYSEFIANTKGKDNLISYCVYKGIETVYIDHDEISKEDAYRAGRKALEVLMNTTGSAGENKDKENET